MLGNMRGAVIDSFHLTQQGSKGSWFPKLRRFLGLSVKEPKLIDYVQFRIRYKDVPKPQIVTWRLDEFVQQLRVNDFRPMQVRYFLNEAKRYARRRPELIRALENLETDLLLHEASKGRHGAGVDFAFVERIG